MAKIQQRIAWYYSLLALAQFAMVNPEAPPKNEEDSTGYIPIVKEPGEEDTANPDEENTNNDPKPRQ